MILGILAAATAALVAWAATQQVRAANLYDGTEAEQVALDVIARVVRNAGAGGGPALWQVAPDRLVLCGVWWRGRVVRGQVVRDESGRLVLAPAPPAAGGSCSGQDLDRPILLVPEARFAGLTFSAGAWDGAAPPRRCGGTGDDPCRGIAGVSVRVVAPGPGAGSAGAAAGTQGYVVLRNPG